VEEQKCGDGKHAEQCHQQQKWVDPEAPVLAAGSERVFEPAENASGDALLNLLRVEFSEALAHFRDLWIVFHP
ncbi:MAG: hypothetical protein ACRD20_07835, partial [Terriglobales bacterium]